MRGGGVIGLRYRIIATLWTSLLAAPLLYAGYVYLSGQCSEIDPCPTGASLPHSGAVAAAVALILAAQIVFLTMTWKSREAGAEGE